MACRTKKLLKDILSLAKSNNKGSATGFYSKNKGIVEKWDFT